MRDDPGAIIPMNTDHPRIVYITPPTSLTTPEQVMRAFELKIIDVPEARNLLGVTPPMIITNQGGNAA